VKWYTIINVSVNIVGSIFKIKLLQIFLKYSDPEDAGIKLFWIIGIPFTN